MIIPFKTTVQFYLCLIPPHLFPARGEYYNGIHGCYMHNSYDAVLELMNFLKKSSVIWIPLKYFLL